MNRGRSHSILPILPLGAAALAAMLAGCAGTGSVSQGTSVVPFANHPASAQPGSRKSWINPALRSKSLLYISDFFEGDILVYTYPDLTFAGELTGFRYPEGECADGAGNVWITSEASTGNVAEYAHGGTSPIQLITVPPPSGEALACAINRKTGDLAVSGGAGDQIFIYHNATGAPTTYADSNFGFTEYLGYDNHGNLFVDGGGASGGFHYAELPAGGSSLEDLTLSETPSAPGNVQWDGQYVAVGDETNTIYRTKGQTVISTLTLSTLCLSQFYIMPSKRRIIAPDLCRATADIYAYPAGGSPIRAITGGLESPDGAVLSR